ncbi:MAG: DNA repair protein RecO [Clostridia bacterium]|nr:DNA repair protein RecO [Clostridia bacterium]
MKKAVDGLILREMPTGESDKLLTVLTAEGRFLMTAKGARSSRSKVTSLCTIFTYGNFEYYEKNDRRWLSSGSVLENFVGMNSELEGIALASYLSQVAYEISEENIDCSEVLRMTLNALHLIKKRSKPYWQIKAVFEVFSAVQSGYIPDLTGCASCGAEERGEFWLDVMNGGLLCADCLRKRAGNLSLPEFDEEGVRNILLPLDASALACLRYVSEAPIERAFAFSLTSEESRAYFCRAAESYLLHHLERGFDSLDFYHQVKD